MIDTANWSAWCIRPEYLEGLLNDPNTLARLRAAVESPEALSAVRGGKTSDDKGYRVVDGVAVIPVVGPLAKRMSYMLWVMGGLTFSKMADMIYDAVDDPQVEAIVLDVDSPGGTVSGTDAFAEAIAAASAFKPVVSFANGCMCSAAYWSASASGSVIVERTASVGSIGVIMVHADFSKMDERFGVKVTVLSAGKYKAVGNEYAPLSDEDRAILQGELDAIYNIFISAVAQHRGVADEKVKSDMAEGRVFIGQAAVDAGLADRVGNLQTAIDAARNLALQVSRGELILPITSTGAASPNKEQKIMTVNNRDKMIVAPTTVAELEAAFPDLAQALRSEGAQAVDTKPAADAERARVMGLVTVHFGAEAGAQFDKVVSTGVTQEQYKAIVGDKAPGAAQATVVQGKDEILAGLTGSGAGNPGADNGSQGLNSGGKDYLSLVDEHMAVFKCTKIDAMKAVMKKNPAAHEAFIQKANGQSVN